MKSKLLLLSCLCYAQCNSPHYHSLLVGLASYVTSQLYSHTDTCRQPARSPWPEITTIAFDLHDVLFEPDYHAMLTDIIHIPHKFRILCTLLKPSFWVDFLRLYWNDSEVIEEYCYTLAEHHPVLYDLIDYCIKITNEFSPVPEMITYSQEMKANGYKLYIFSNIGKKTFTALTEKYPDCFEHFDGYWVSCPEKMWLQKPTPQAYIDFLTTFSLQPNDVLFVDDKRENITAAQAVGMTTIHFESVDQFLQVAL